MLELSLNSSWRSAAPFNPGAVLSLESVNRYRFPTSPGPELLSTSEHAVTVQLLVVVNVMDSDSRTSHMSVLSSTILSSVTFVVVSSPPPLVSAVDMAGIKAMTVVNTMYTLVFRFTTSSPLFARIHGKDPYAMKSVLKATRSHKLVPLTQVGTDGILGLTPASLHEHNDSVRP